MWKEIEVIGKCLLLFSVIVFNMMKLLPILQLKTKKTMINELYSAR